MEDDDEGAGKVPAEGHRGDHPDCGREMMVHVEEAVIKEEDGNLDEGHGELVEDFGGVENLRPPNQQGSNEAK